MFHTPPEEHGPGLTLAASELGAVSICSCGVVTLTLQVLSLRLEAPAFRELQRLLTLAQQRLDGATPSGAASAPATDTSPLH